MKLSAGSATHCGRKNIRSRISRKTRCYRWLRMGIAVPTASSRRRGSAFQERMVALFSRAAGAYPHRSVLGHGTQGRRRERFFRLHYLGRGGQRVLPALVLARQSRVSRVEKVHALVGARMETESNTGGRQSQRSKLNTRIKVRECASSHSDKGGQGQTGEGGGDHATDRGGGEGLARGAELSASSAGARCAVHDGLFVKELPKQFQFGVSVR